MKRVSITEAVNILKADTTYRKDVVCIIRIRIVCVIMTDTTTDAK